MRNYPRRVYRNVSIKGMCDTYERESMLPTSSFKENILIPDESAEVSRGNLTCGISVSVPLVS